MMYGFSKEQQQNALRKKCAEYHERLEKGWDMCDRNPGDKRMEDHWLKLLKEYESAVLQYVTLGGATGEL